MLNFHKTSTRGLCMRLVTSFFLIFLLFTTSQAAGNREGTWQVSFTPHYVASKSLRFGDKGSVDFNDRSGWGLGVGYNFTDHVSLDLDFTSSNGSYNGSVNESNGSVSNYSGNMYSSSIDLALTYNILKSNFTPYLSADIGSSFIDSGIPTGNYYGGTCYDPWYGYYYQCVDAETHTTTKFHYGAGAGLRYDFKNRLFLKGGVNVDLLDFNSDQTPYFIDYRISIGTTFN